RAQARQPDDRSTREAISSALGPPLPQDGAEPPLGPAVTKIRQRRGSCRGSSFVNFSQECVRICSSNADRSGTLQTTITGFGAAAARARMFRRTVARTPPLKAFAM